MEYAGFWRRFGAFWIDFVVPSSTKIATSIMLALIHSPLVVAVVLVFKPASFASFKSPLPGDVVKEASNSKS